MCDKLNPYYAAFERPQGNVINLSQTRALKSKKRALHERVYESPSKRTKRCSAMASAKKGKRRIFGAAPPPPDDITNEDSSLLDLLQLKYNSSNSNLSLDKSIAHSQSSQSPVSSNSSSSLSPVRLSMSSVSCRSPVRVVNSCLATLSPSSSARKDTKDDSVSYLDIIQTPPQVKKRQKLTPVPVPSSTSPSWSSHNNKTTQRQRGSVSRTNLEGVFNQVGEEEKLVTSPCLDLSLKSKLSLTANYALGFNCGSLMSSEESSGISAFARCIDINPDRKGSLSENGAGSQLDTSLGAQFHQCCLFWQHPSLPNAILFPRETSAVNSAQSPPMNGIRLDQKVLEAMFLEWVDAVRSLFQLVRTRQCPYFYLCTQQFTCLFCAAGTLGHDFLQVYITPGSKGFRESLKQHGIEFNVPTIDKDVKIDENNSSFPKAADGEESDHEDDQEPDRWLDEIGISQDVSLSQRSSPPSIEDRSRTTVICIAGNSTMQFLNFLINSKNLIVASTGPFADVPPTLLSPVAFHGATLKQLKVKQIKGKKNGPGPSSCLYNVELEGPILPHVMHMLCPLLSKSLKEYKLRVNTLPTTANFNLKPEVRGNWNGSGNAFELQNLSDCGLARSVLELFCKPRSMDTINNLLEYNNGKYSWS